jgi:hypothetical protein
MSMGPIEATRRIDAAPYKHPLSGVGQERLVGEKQGYSLLLIKILGARS